MVYFEAVESVISIKEIGATLNRALQKRAEVRVVYLFGSRARGTQKNSKRIIYLDIGSHILSALGKNNSETYTDIIDKLAQEKILPPDFTLKIGGMAGLRNILVHDYLDVDVGRIYKILRYQLEDFRTFCRLIIEYLEQ